MYDDREDVIFQWFKRSGKGDDIFLAKTDNFAVQFDPHARIKICSEPRNAKVTYEKSLQGLGVNTIDLYYCHGVTPIGKTTESVVKPKK